MKKYFMLDHGGVLDGIITENVPGDDDILIEQVDNELYQILKNGVQIVKQLNILVEKYEFEIVFHSKNKEQEQLQLLKQLTIACNKKGLTWPKVTAMAVRDPETFAGIDSKNPIITISKDYDILIAGYAEELDGKSCVRSALSQLLEIEEKLRFQHIVFDDGPSVISAAKSEGYQAYLINQDFPLDKAINEVYQNISETYKKNESENIQLMTVNELENQLDNKEIYADKNYNQANLFFKFELLKQQEMKSTNISKLDLSVENLKKDTNHVIFKKTD